jgi:hypothetical protein
VVDDKVHDHLQPALMGGVGEPAQQRIVVPMLIATKARVELVVVFDGVEAPRKAGVMKRVDINSIEAHRRDAGQMCRPLTYRARQCRKQIINPEPFAHAIDL